MTTPAAPTGRIAPTALAALKRRAARLAWATIAYNAVEGAAELTDQACYDLAWIPAPFVPEPAFSTGVGRIVTALRPGGLLMIGHGRFDGTDLQNAITRFKTVAHGGTALDSPSAARLLHDHGLTSVQTAPTPPGAPSITAGRR